MGIDIPKPGTYLMSKTRLKKGEEELMLYIRGDLEYADYDTTLEYLVYYKKK